MAVNLPDTSCLIHLEPIDRLDALRGSGFWLSDALYERALDRAGERPPDT
jgi:predicted nucleic acid-binding protein